MSLGLLLQLRREHFDLFPQNVVMQEICKQAHYTAWNESSLYLTPEVMYVSSVINTGGFYQCNKLI